MTSVESFDLVLRRFLQNSLGNSHVDNHMWYYASGVRRVMYLDMVALELFDLDKRQEKLRELEPLVRATAEAMAPLYRRLADDASRETLVRVAAFRIIGYRHVKMPYYESSNIHDRELLAARTRMPDSEKLASFLERLRAEWHTDSLALYNLYPVGRPMVVYSVAENIYMEMNKPAYRYETADSHIGVREGDVVIDCGAGLGDQALFFAEKAGESGLVVCLEPHPGNARICFQNLRLNPRLARRIIPHHVGAWHEDNVMLPLSFDGCSSHLAAARSPDGSFPDADPAAGNSARIRCRTLDSLVKQLPRQDVSFIKMDIEGAEMNALAGAVQTLRRCKPRLALSIYHRLSDFHAMPEFIDSLALGYRFHLGHHAPDAADTILYAVAQ